LDGGLSWSPLNHRSDVATAVVAGTEPRTFYFYGYAFGGYGLSRSLDGGKTLDDFLDHQWRGLVTAVVPSPMDPARVYFGTAGSGLLRLDPD
jgi:hypothetical protein